jgi:ketosteroid isomerase-like protein
MSQEDVEIVQRGIETWNRRDLTTWLALFSSDAEIDWSRARGPLKGVYRGPGEIETLWNEFFFMFEEAQIETTHGFTDAGSEVVVSNTSHFRGRQGIEVSASSTWVFTVADGQITCLRLFQKRAEALEAVGLKE